jgi:hypothetical protein
MPTPPSFEPAEAVADRQQQDAERLVGRLAEIRIADLPVHYTLQQSSVVLPGILVRLLALAVLFRLDSAKKWHLALHGKALPEPVRRWLGLEELTGLVDRAVVDCMRA